jgi:hypothetical protein
MSETATAQVIQLRPSAPRTDYAALMTAIGELHGLISLDPVMGATPLRIYFVFNPAAKARIAQHLDPADRAVRRQPAAYALVAYDFPFALQMFEMAARPFSPERAKEIISLNAALQGDMLQAAAGVLAIDVRPVLAFDAGALKQVFFPGTQETLTHLFQLDLNA